MLLEDARDDAIPRAVPAASASMREQHDPVRIRRHGNIAVQRDAAR